MRMRIMTRLTRVLIDLIFLLALLLLGSGSYIMWGLGPTLFLLGAVLLFMLLLALILRGRHVQSAISK